MGRGRVLGWMRWRWRRGLLPDVLGHLSMIDDDISVWRIGEKKGL